MYMYIYDELLCACLHMYMSCFPRPWSQRSVSLVTRLHRLHESSVGSSSTDNPKPWVNHRTACSSLVNQTLFSAALDVLQWMYCMQYIQRCGKKGLVHETTACSGKHAGIVSIQQKTEPLRCLALKTKSYTRTEFMAALVAAAIKCLLTLMEVR